MNAPTLEVRVGAFLLAAVAVAVGFVLLLGRVSFGAGEPLCADFAYLGNLETGAPVKISGVNVGQVRSIALLLADTSPPPAKSADGLGRSAAPQVRACVTLEKRIAQLITDSAVLAVASQGVIGEAYLELEPHVGAALPAGQPLRGVDAPKLHVMALQVAAIMNVAGELFKPSDAQAPQDVGKSVMSLLSTVNGLLTERRPAILTALDNVAAASNDFRQVAAGLKTGVGDGEPLRSLIAQTRDAVAVLQREVPPMASHGNQALATLQALGDKANRALDANTLEAVMHDTKAAAAHLEQLTADAQAMTKAARRGEGTLGGFAQDPQIYDDVKEMLRDLKQHPWKVLWRD